MNDSVSLLQVKQLFQLSKFAGCIQIRLHNKLADNFDAEPFIITVMENGVAQSGQINDAGTQKHVGSGACMNARIERIIYGADDVGCSNCDQEELNKNSPSHKIKVYRNFMEDECKKELSEFFKTIRDK